jgi:predicted pyridoxine 5'-phosphate oxidase superfamily flavin-nucleotide-binding protein
MDHLTTQMQQIIRNYNAGSVATVNADGTPSVSPKATFVIVDERCIAYGNIRSPGTSANLRDRPAVEVNFIDVLARLAVRVRGRATLVACDSVGADPLLPQFEALWAAYIEQMSEFVRIDIEQAELISSPAYDLGLQREELMQANFAKLSKLVESGDKDT